MVSLSFETSLNFFLFDKMCELIRSYVLVFGKVITRELLNELHNNTHKCYLLSSSVENAMLVESLVKYWCSIGLVRL